MDKEIVEKIEWKSFDGRTASVGNLSQQHLSNILHYHRYAIPAMGAQARIPDYEIAMTEKIVLSALESKGWDLLPYRPHPMFGHEIKALVMAGYLRDDGDIIVNGKKVGEASFVLTKRVLTEKVRQQKTKPVFRIT